MDHFQSYAGQRSSIAISFPGPQIITALSQAAQRAITAYNTSVHTNISASPVASINGAEHDDDDDEEDNEDDDEPDYEEDEDNAPSIAESDDLEEYRKSRKQSVVSVSTTISTKTETISPQPHIRASLSRHASTEDENDSEEDEDGRRQALEDLGAAPFYRSLLLLAQMSSADNFFTPQYTTACLEHAREHRDFVMGFIAQQTLNESPDDNFIIMTPGVQKAAGGDGMGQQYNTPRKVITEGGADIIIVGRGVLNASDRQSEAYEYRKQGWLAYEERLRLKRRDR